MSIAATTIALRLGSPTGKTAYMVAFPLLALIAAGMT